MLSYLDYLDIAETAEDKLDSKTSLDQKSQTGLLAMLEAHTSRAYWLWNREFSADIRPALATRPLNTNTLITTLADIATTQLKTPNGEFENLITAVYTYLKQKNRMDLYETLDAIEVNVFFGRDGHLIRTGLNRLLIKDGMLAWKLPKKKYELYQLHALSVIDDEPSPYLQAKTILSAYAGNWSRSYRLEVKAMIEATKDLDNLLSQLVALINNPEKFRGFTPDGDFEHAIVALYLILNFDTRLAEVSVFLDEARPRSLKTIFPPTRSIIITSSPPSSRGGSAAEYAISPGSAFSRNASTAGASSHPAILKPKFGS